MKQAVKILYWLIKAADVDVVVTAFAAVHLNSRDKNVLLHQVHISHQILQMQVKKKLVAEIKDNEDGNSGRFYQFYQCGDR